MSVVSILSTISSSYVEQNLRKAMSDASKASRRISSGAQIIEPSDDPSGLAISMGLTNEIETLSAGMRNASQARSLLAVADDTLESISDILNRMRTLSVQASSGSLTPAGLSALDDEVNEIADELEREATNAVFNNINLLDGTFNNKSFQVGTSGTNTITFSLTNATATNLGVTATALDLVANLAGSTTAINNAIDTISAQRSHLGSVQRRFEYASSVLESSIENLRSARAIYTDADIASETTVLDAADTKSKAAIGVLAQLNRLPRELLKLINA